MKNEQTHYLNSILEMVSSQEEGNTELARTLIYSLGLKNEFIDLLVHEIQEKQARISFINFEWKSSTLNKSLTYKKEFVFNKEVHTLRTSILALQLFKLNLTKQ
jgi:hypothetical protein